jgi:hypothetical protein
MDHEFIRIRRILTLRAIYRDIEMLFYRIGLELAGSPFFRPGYTRQKKNVVNCDGKKKRSF